MSHPIYTPEELIQAESQAYKQGKQDMLDVLLAEAADFRDKLNQRRYFNNANGVTRFINHVVKEIQAR